MPVFQYLAKDGSGRSRNGSQEAGSAGALASELRGRGWLVLDIRAAESSGSGGASLNPWNWLPPTSLDVEISLQQIAVMLRSGLTLLAALQTVRDNARRDGMRRVWEDVSSRIQEGAGLAEAMAPCRCFPHLVIQLVRVGEQTGALDLVLSRGAEAMERRRTLKNSLLTALMYPTLVVFVALGITGFLVFSVIPKVERFLAALGRKLPAMTQTLVDITQYITTYAFEGSAALFGLTGAAIALYLWPPGRLWIDRWALRLPVLGAVLRLSGTAMFARGLGILLRSGVTLLESLQTVEPLLGNSFLRERIAVARQEVMQGGTLAAPLAAKDAFMPMLAGMASVGEASGTLDEVLEEVAEFHEAQLQATIKRLSALIEPVIIIVVGGIVGFVYIAFFLALFAAGGAK